MVDILAGKLGTSRKFILYPAQRTGTVHTAAEYTINSHLTTVSNVVHEIGTWDTHQYTDGVRNDLAEDQGSRNYIFAVQQGRRDIEDEDHKHYHADDRINERTGRIKDLLEHALDPDRGSNPWNNSIFFWNRWSEDDAEDEDFQDPDTFITVAEQQAYMNKVKEALT